MKWINLKSYKCPKCDTALVVDEAMDVHRCGHPRCTFKISDQKLKEIITDRKKIRPIDMPTHDEEENMLGLNSL